MSFLIFFNLPVSKKGMTDSRLFKKKRKKERKKERKILKYIKKERKKERKKKEIKDKFF